MEKIRLEDFLEYNYLSSLSVTEEGVFFIQAQANKERDGYDRYLWTLRDGKAVKLTHDGKAGEYTESSIVMLSGTVEQISRYKLIFRKQFAMI